MESVMQEKLKELFGEEALTFKEGLKSWAKSNGFGFELEQGEWLREGKILVNNGARWVRVAVRTPDELGSAAKLAGSWGLAFSDWIGAVDSLVARSAEGWRVCNRVTHGWDVVEFEPWWHAHLGDLLGRKAQEN